ncbi:hypothetical protein SAMN04490248_101251 [Salinihabitans flavidus]|uniref:Flagellar protein FliL n=1 Tax=Salinihabitans flavidus TaxID=569882 RepID=A0A1H8LQM9_9RHOB|nr:flagellar basal body-associated FliL family protein [Salinihabitans flavidus]SEO07425.1 hypothetical protein SAMN04490248_101251 [Salinihabitans flavidus]
MQKLLPLLLALIGIGGGGVAGYLLKPKLAEVPLANPCGDEQSQPGTAAAEPVDVEDRPTSVGIEYVKLNNQFVVPVVKDEMVTSLIVLTLSLEVKTGQRELVFEREPKLRDALLQAMFDHANLGGFHGAFTNPNKLDPLRLSLRETARKILGNAVGNVLITDLARQDV